MTLGLNCYFIMAQYNACVNFTSLQHLLAIVIISMLDASAEVLCVNHKSDETKVYKIYICLFSSKHSWSVWTSDEVGSELMCLCGVICIHLDWGFFQLAQCKNSEPASLFVHTTAWKRRLVLGQCVCVELSVYLWTVVC